jgi:hypothetical protein
VLTPKGYAAVGLKAPVGSEQGSLL